MWGGDTAAGTASPVHQHGRRRSGGGSSPPGAMLAASPRVYTSPRRGSRASRGSIASLGGVRSTNRLAELAAPKNAAEQVQRSPRWEEGGVAVAAAALLLCGWVCLCVFGHECGGGGGVNTTRM